MLGLRELERVRAVVGRAHDLHTAVELEQCPNRCQTARNLTSVRLQSFRNAGPQPLRFSFPFFFA
jgi:hypothetical protein